MNWINHLHPLSPKTRNILDLIIFKSNFSIRWIIRFVFLIFSLLMPNLSIKNSFYDYFVVLEPNYQFMDSLELDFVCFPYLPSSS